MHKVSRTLLLAGVLAFGTLSAACGDTVNTTLPSVTGVSAVSVTPASATIQVGETIQLSTSVTADATTAKTVTYTSSNTAVATVDAAGKVTGVKAGTVSVNAVSTADASKSAAAAITVTAGPVTQPATISINSVNDAAGAPVNLANVNGQVNVTVNTTGGGSIEVFLSPSANCASNTIAASDVSVASQAATSTSNGTVTLSFNTAQLSATNAAKFANGSYCVKARLTPTTGAAVIATNTVPFTLNNVNTYNATLAFASQTTGPTSAVSSLNGLSYNQGTLTVTVKPVIYTSSSPVALVSGYVTRNGEQAGVNPAAAGRAVFTNVAVANGVATFVLADTAGAAAATSLYRYTSLAAGDSVVITSATDAAGNVLTSANVPVQSGVRIDNDGPRTTGVIFSVVAPNGYIGGTYKFASGTGGAGVVADSLGGISGVGGVTTTYYVGTAGSAAFATANSCNVTGLKAATTGADLDNTTTTTAYAAKVVVQDALGNKTCADVPAALFGVDKIAPSIAFSTATTVAKDLTGYNATKNFAFTYSDTISGFNPASPLRGSLSRTYLAGTPTAADCLIGTWNNTAKTCADTVSVPATVEFTNSTGASGYYQIRARSHDQAGNESATLVRVAAFDNVAPVVATPTAPSAIASLGSVSLSATATDNLDLTSARGQLVYATATPFAGTSGTSFGANFDATLATSATATVSLGNVYRGLQSVDGSNVILLNSATPAGRIVATDVGGNSASSGNAAIATTTGNANILVGDSLRVSIPAPSAGVTAATTTLTIVVGGGTADAAFQSQPFTQIDIYKLDAAKNELVLVGSVSAASVTDAGAIRTYTYTASGVALTANSLNSFFVVGRNAAGDAVISNGVSYLNP
jgi:hypothetical protein